MLFERESSLRSTSRTSSFMLSLLWPDEMGGREASCVRGGVPISLAHLNELTASIQMRCAVLVTDSLVLLVRSFVHFGLFLINARARTSSCPSFSFSPPSVRVRDRP